MDIMRSQLGRARGLGAAKSGLHHWWMQRLTAVALVPLTLWFIYSVLVLQGATHAALIAWMGNPFHLVLLLALIVATFHHVQLGLQSVLEDYIHTETCRLASVLVMKGLAALLALTGVVSALKLGL
ncbi:MAG: succinate dehydrogenase, hydrophobic membrane anchor protein [Acetobacteraceae bacterium]|nr:succinate dehydrogenase, hydrophobic membrane anchor protein [Acetobacteraceae bacterium]MSP30931.1 succinate dehydrogenase, hydrophobic membrane anchor protein [Acetobacteraceae bacterium]